MYTDRDISLVSAIREVIGQAEPICSYLMLTYARTYAHILHITLNKRTHA